MCVANNNKAYLQRLTQFPIIQLKSKINRRNFEVTTYKIENGTKIH